MKNNSFQIALTGLILLAIALRFWNLLKIPFTYDELSTIFRMSVPEWNLALEKIAEDGHPPAHHLLIRGIMSLSGTREWVIKLPFILAGALSIPLLYKIGASYFNRNVGLLSAATLCISQFHLMHSQIARPYSIGLFFVLIVFWLLIKNAELDNKEQKWLSAIWIAIGISATFYLHYFAALMGVLSWIYFLLPNYRNKGLSYYLIPLMVAILCVPMIPFLITQWGHGGLPAILGQQSISFIPGFIFRVMNFSWVLIGAIIFILLLSATSSTREIRIRRIGILLLFITPLSIIWIYSLVRSPILSERSLFFALPFLLLFIFSFVKEKWDYKTQLGFVLILLIGTINLIFVRKHYAVFYHLGFEDVAKLSVEKANINSLSIINFNPEIYRPIEKKYPEFQQLNLINPDSTVAYSTYVDALKNGSFEMVQIGHTAEYYPFPLEVIPLIEENYPIKSTTENYFLSFYQCFEKGNFERAYRKNLSTLRDEEWKIPEQMKGSEENPHIDYSDSEWGVEFNANCLEFITAPTDYLFVEFNLDLEEEKMPDALIVMEIRSGDHVRHVKVNSFEDFFIPTDDGGHIYLVMDMSDYNIKSDFNFKGYIWNRNKEPFFLTSAKVWTEEGNPTKYALVKPF